MSDPTPVVLLHGFATSSARTWWETGWLDLLADAGRKTVPIDILGHGKAEKPHDAAAYSDLEGYVAERLPADGPRPEPPPGGKRPQGRHHLVASPREPRRHHLDRSEPNVLG